MLVTLTSDNWTNRINWSNMFTFITISTVIFTVMFTSIVNRNTIIIIKNDIKYHSSAITSIHTQYNGNNANISHNLT